MNNLEERIDPLLTYQTEYQEWFQKGCEKAEAMINSDKKLKVKM